MNQFEKDRRISRRRMAQISFTAMIVIGLAIVAALLFSDNRTEIANALSTAAGVIGTIFFMFTSIVLGYLATGPLEKNSILKHGKGLDDAS